MTIVYYYYCSALLLLRVVFHTPDIAIAGRRDGAQINQLTYRSGLSVWNQHIDQPGRPSTSMRLASE